MKVISILTYICLVIWLHMVGIGQCSYYCDYILDILELGISDTWQTHIPINNKLKQSITINLSTICHNLFHRHCPRGRGTDPPCPREWVDGGDGVSPVRARPGDCPPKQNRLCRHQQLIGLQLLSAAQSVSDAGAVRTPCPASQIFLPRDKNILPEINIGDENIWLKRK